MRPLHAVPAPLDPGKDHYDPNPTTNRTQRTVIAGPRSPTNRPPWRKSRTSTRPVAKAMAFGGVEMGMHIAVEALSATGTAIPT